MNVDPALKKIAAEAGVDPDRLAALEVTAKTHLDLDRIRQGQTPELGYILIERQFGPDALVVFAEPAAAEDALEESELIDDLCQEDCLGASVITPTSTDLPSREVIIGF